MYFSPISISMEKAATLSYMKNLHNNKSKRQQEKSQHEKIASRKIHNFFHMFAAPLQIPN